jgi:hypothetical protein
MESYPKDNLQDAGHQVGPKDSGFYFLIYNGGSMGVKKHKIMVEIFDIFYYLLFPTYILDFL